MNYTCKKRLGAEAHYLNEFITPNAYEVERLREELAQDNDFVLAAWRWVAQNISYPPSDYHESWFYLNRWGLPQKHFNTWDWWSYPSETLVLGAGDCEDTSVLLCSLLSGRVPGIYVTLGKWKEYYHAWPVIQVGNSNYILESTLDLVPWNTAYYVTEQSNPLYDPFIRFDVSDTIIIKNPEVLDLTKVNEEFKLKEMKKYWR